MKRIPLIKIYPIYKNKICFYAYVSSFYKGIYAIGTKMAYIEKKNEYNLKTNVENTKFSNFFSHKC